MTSSHPHAVRRAGVAVAAAGLAVLAAAAVLPGAVADGAAPIAEAGPVSFTLPPPTGPHQVGTLDVHLLVGDESRAEALDGGPRELMASIWYPAHHSSEAAPTPYLPRRVASFYDQTSAELGITPGSVDFAGAVSHAQTRAPVDVSDGPRPVVLYSPGGGLSRALGTVVVEELVSHGYVVVTVDSTGQAPVELPDGLVLPAADQEVGAALSQRVADLRSVLDSLESVAAGGNPDVQGRPLPEGLGAVLDLDRVGGVGHSLGGFAVVEAMRVDPRVDAGVNLDGSLDTRLRTALPGRERDARLDRPFLLVGAGADDGTGGPHHHLASPDWRHFWSTLTGWRRDLYLPDGEHLGFTDLQSILPQLDGRLGLDDDAVTAAIGTVDPEAGLAVQRTYLTAFFDQHLRDMHRAVLDAVPDTYPAELVP